ncbi:hypothetical protein GVAV_002335 [Gurleya vavrai]
MQESFNSQKEMSSKILQILKIFKSHQFDIEEDFDFYKRVCNFQSYFNEISFKYTKDCEKIYHKKKFYSFFVKEICDMKGGNDVLVKSTFYKYQAPKEFFENLYRKYNRNGPLNETIELQEISENEASYFKESFYEKFLAVVEIEITDHNQIFYIFPTDYNLSRNILAIDFYKKEKFNIFNEFYNEFTYLFNKFPDFEHEQTKNFFKEIFTNLETWELIFIISDKFKFNFDINHEKLFIMRAAISYELNLKRTKTETQIESNKSDLKTLLKELEISERLHKEIDFDEFELSSILPSVEIFLPVMFIMFDFLRLKFFEIHEKTENYMMRNYKLITKKCFRYDEKYNYIFKNFLGLSCDIDTTNPEYRLSFLKLQEPSQ